VAEKVKSNHFKIFYDSLTFSIPYSVIGVIQSHAEMKLDLSLAINTVDVSFHAIQHFVMTCPAQTQIFQELANICTRNFTQHELENYKK
jgi:hypothetical protein